MHHWFGTKQDSERQTSERNSRAARRIIREQLTIPTNQEDSFYDAETSINLNLDGGGSVASSTSSAASSRASSPAMPDEPVTFHDQNEADDGWPGKFGLKGY